MGLRNCSDPVWAGWVHFTKSADRAHFSFRQKFDSKSENALFFRFQSLSTGAHLSFRTDALCFLKSANEWILWPFRQVSCNTVTHANKGGVKPACQQFFTREPVLSWTASKNEKGRSQINLPDSYLFHFMPNPAFLVAGFWRRIFESYLLLLYFPLQNHIR